MEEEILRKLEEKSRRKSNEKKLEQILSSSIFKKMVIDSAAMHKIKAYSSVLSKLKGEYECMGYLVSPPDSHLVWDAVLCKKQHVTPSFGQGFGGRETAEEIHGKGLEIMGFWHSHAGHGFVSPSSIDLNADKNLFSSHKIEIYSSLGNLPVSQIKEENELSYVVQDPPHSKTRRIIIHDNTGGSEPTIEQQELLFMKFIYNLIINNQGENELRLLYKILEPNKKEYGEIHKLDIGMDTNSQFSSYVDCSYLDIADELLEEILIEGRPLKEDKEATGNYNQLSSSLSKRRIKNDKITSAPEIDLGELVVPSAETVSSVTTDETIQLRSELKTIEEKHEQIQKQLTTAEKASSDLEEKMKEHYTSNKVVETKIKKDVEEATTKAVKKVISEFEQKIKTDYILKSEAEVQVAQTTKTAQQGLFTQKQLEDVLNKAVKKVASEFEERDSKTQSRIKDLEQQSQEMRKERAILEKVYSLVKEVYEPGKLPSKEEPSKEAKTPKPIIPTPEPPKEDFYAQGLILYQKGEYKDALDTFKKSVKAKEREGTDSLCYVGNCHLEMDQRKKALQIYEECITKNKNDSTALYNMGKISFISGDIPEALQKWQESVNLGSDYAIDVINNFETHLGYCYDRNLTKGEKEQLNTLKGIIVQNAAK